MKTAVVILNYNGEAVLRQFLPSVVKFTTASDVSIIVADNASADGSLSLLEETFPEIQVIKLEKNFGFAEGYNKALAQVDADYYVLLNSDVEVTEGWIEPLLAFMNSHPDVAAVQPKILKYAATPAKGGNDCPSFEYAGASGGFIDKYGYPYCRGRIFSAVEHDEGQYDDPVEVHWASGACFMIRAADYKAADGMDGRFFAHNEEIDLCWRLRISGRRIFCLPQSKVWHVGGATLPQGDPRKVYLNFRNNLTMIYKNMPQKRLGGVLRMRHLLDNISIIFSFITGHKASARAIFNARKDFCNWKNNFKRDRDMIQSNRQLSSDKDTSPVSILWQYCILRHRKWSSLRTVLLLLLLVCGFSANADDKTRGIGVYPGRTEEAFSPSIINGGETSRNLSCFHQAYHSSCYDYNLTAQLVTDGILAQAELPRIDVLVNGVSLKKNEREYAIDGNDWNKNILAGSDVSYCLNWYGMKVDADSVVLNCTVAYHKEPALHGYEIKISDGKNIFALEQGASLPGSDMGYELDSDPNKQTGKDMLPARAISKGYSLNTTDSLSTFLLEMKMDGAAYWAISDIKFFKKGMAVDTDLLPISQFQSAWMSESGGNQWVYVDLGDRADIQEVRLYWMRHIPKGILEVSDDAVNWTEIAQLPEDDPYYVVPVTASGRYVRVSVEGYNKPYMLSEMEVFGCGGTVVEPYKEAGVKDNILSLNGGNWRLQRASAAKYPGEVVSLSSFPARYWLPATVPATVLTSYVNAQAVQNPNYDDHIKYASESYFYSDFYYRREFELPEEFTQKSVYLNIDGINWKAQLWLNGKKIGSVEGAFMRGKIDITSKLKKGKNVLAVMVERPAHPGATKEKTYEYPGPNGGLLGYDNPTFHASTGWDWIPTVRGREIGIWNDIYLSAEEGVSLSDPLISTTLNLPDTLATLSPVVTYYNNEGKQVKGSLHGWIGNLTFQKEVSLKPGRGNISFDPEDFPELNNVRMHLWWPNGYGAPYLYDAGFCLTDDEKGDTLSVITFKQGIRQMTYQDEQTALKIFVNGRRVVPLGGNWGFSEQNLNFRKREYDIAVRNHRDMNFNMIRNWVGQTGDEEFYDACDKYGIMVWQDFWLANPADGPDPADGKLFEKNALDYITKIRHHACIALYCGRNEGYPAETLDDNLKNLTAVYHPGIVYISSSADDGVSGHGPYNALPAKEYFESQTGLFHSETGMPNIMTFEGLQRTMSDGNQWPQNDVWGQHDYTMTGAQKGSSFNALIAGRFGEPLSAQQFTSWAQLVNYEGYRAMYESGSKDRMGLLIWMSHSCWPSLAWQCYDYYFEPTGAYFGCKKACEPLHIQRNASTGKVEIVNIGTGTFKKLKAQAEVFNLAGDKLSTTVKKANSKSDSTTELFEVAGDVVRLSLFQGKCLLSENTYILAENMKELPVAEVSESVSETKASAGGDEREVTVNIENKGNVTAYLLRLNLLDENGEQILPVRYSDNYFHLMPHEKKSVTVRWAAEDQQTNGTKVELTGINI